MATGKDEQGRPALFVADIGDNLGGAWPYVTVYRVPEPDWEPVAGVRLHA